MSSGQSLRNGNSVEPGLPKTLRIPNARSRSSVTCLTVRDLAPLPAFLLDIIPAPSSCLFSVVIARSAATRQSVLNFPFRSPGLLRSARSDDLMRSSPRRGALHRRLAGGIRGPQLHAVVGGVCIDAELAAFEQRLQPAIAVLFRRLAAAQLGCEFNYERCLQRSVEDQAGIALDLGAVVAGVMDAVAVEGQRRIAKQQHRIGHVAFAMLGNRRRCGWLGGGLRRARDVAIDDVLPLADGR